MVDTTTFTPTQLWAGEVSEDRVAVTVKQGQNLAANTLVMLDADGKVVAHDGVITTTLTQSGTTPFAATLSLGHQVYGILIAAIDATSADTAGRVYRDGDFIDSKLVWPATIDGLTKTDLLKHKMLQGTEINTVIYPAGAL